ncbi:hypothetical protein BC940DRAFT_331274 [Gongronella butleri]|nr:hypothetical protein BC940DRAFT_331274 [Gongronella butleri]
MELRVKLLFDQAYSKFYKWKDTRKGVILSLPDNAGAQHLYDCNAQSNISGAGQGAPKNATDAQDTTTARDDDDAALEHRVVENDEDWEALIAEYNFPGEPSQLEDEIEDAQSDAEIADDFDEGELFDWALIIDELRTIGDARYSMTFYMTMPLVDGRSENRPEPDDLDVFTIPGSFA